MLPDSESKLNIALDGPNSDGQIKIQLYDADTFLDDRLGTFQLDLRGATGIFNTDLGDKKLGAHYQIAWETYY